MNYKFLIFIFTLFVLCQSKDLDNIKSQNRDYVYYERFGFYKFHLMLASWLNAKHVCELEGAHLVVLNSQGEADLMIDIANKYFVANDVWHGVYVGIHDINKEGIWETVTGQLLQDSGFMQWDQGQPDNRNNSQDCGYLQKNYRLDDADCGFMSYFICEKNV